MRILHTSDWHLGRLFYGIHLTDDQAYVLEDFIRLVRDSKPDVIVVAGDLYDRSVPPIEAVELLDEVFTKILMDLKVPIVAIAGNHDSPDRINFGSRLLRANGLHICGKLTEGKEIEPVVVEDKFGSVAFYALPYIEPAIMKELSGDENIHNHNDSMKAAMELMRRSLSEFKRKVLVGHAFVAGGEGSESERPLSVGGSGSVDWNCFEDFSYTALGHLHRPQKIGKENIRYSGSLMKYSFSEANQKKLVYLVDIDEEGNVTTEEVSLRTKRDVRCIEGNLEELLLNQQTGVSKEDYIMVTLKDRGVVLDPMGRLRKIYPNTLHIERAQFNLDKEDKLLGAGRDYKKINHVDMFTSFFEQVTSREFSNNYSDTYAKIIDQCLKEAE